MFARLQVTHHASSLRECLSFGPAIGSPVLTKLLACADRSALICPTSLINSALERAASLGTFQLFTRANLFTWPPEVPMRSRHRSCTANASVARACSATATRTATATATQTATQSLYRYLCAATQLIIADLIEWRNPLSVNRTRLDLGWHFRRKLHSRNRPKVFSRNTLGLALVRAPTYQRLVIVKNDHHSSGA